MNPSVLPEGDVAPADGSLPEVARTQLAARPFGVYVHVPYCRSRCGYCDFNTYTTAELGSEPGAGREAYLAAIAAEVRLSGDVLRGVPGGAAPAGHAAPPISTVFFGGGTPTLLPASAIGGLLARLGDEFGLAAGAEVTIEANPETVGPASLAALRSVGVNRISFGMQSAVGHVLAVLDRQHTPGRALTAVEQARAAGFESISLDLIYGTPGESAADWATSLGAAVSSGVDHVSAYSLIVEPGTRLAARVRRGELPEPDPDELADKYLQADEALVAAGFAAYEVSNWARRGHECRHNLAYWRGDNWWGFGPGAHSHVGGVRWWNVLHPRTYSARLLAAARASPAHARELLSAGERRVERVLLELRLAEGLDLAVLTATERARAGEVVSSGLGFVRGSRLVLTLRGRLLADAVIRDLLD